MWLDEVLLVPIRQWVLSSGVFFCLVESAAGMPLSGVDVGSQPSLSDGGVGEDRDFGGGEGWRSDDFGFLGLSVATI